MNRFFTIAIVYLKLVILGNKRLEGYIFKEIGNEPIVGLHHYEGYEIINPNTNKVLYRKVNDWGYIGCSNYSYNVNRYNVIRKFFPENIVKRNTDK